MIHKTHIQAELFKLCSLSSQEEFVFNEYSCQNVFYKNLDARQKEI